MMPSLAVLTGTRAEYGIFRPLLRAFADRGWPFELYVTGTHLEDRFGRTIQEVEADGFPIAERLPLNLVDDTPATVGRAMGAAMTSLAAVLERRRPGLLFILGDRFEALAAAAAARICNIPIAHLHGGELTEGAVDEAFRHAITKLAHLHFVATQTYRQRVIQMGEQEADVFCVGALGLDNLQSIEWLGRESLEADIGMPLRARNILVTQHPLTLDLEQSGRDCRALLQALTRFEDIGLIFTLPNADPGGARIASMIDAFAAERPTHVRAIASLGTRRYFSLLRQVDLVVGNSSSGLIEVPAFGIPTVNVGARQKGRIAGASVIHAPGYTDAIAQAIDRALDPEVRAVARREPNPYGDGETAEKICEALGSLNYPLNVQKAFNDRPAPSA
jgi:UDP-hydrolysing UDP-N-acetyl-D-glucosamine 2-epimerase